MSELPDPLSQRSRLVAVDLQAEVVGESNLCCARVGATSPNQAAQHTEHFQVEQGRGSPQNCFLASTGSIGAINCDGTAAVGHFWSQALGSPLVWDQDEETANQSPAGGSKITWSGPPLMPRHGRGRLRFVLSASDLADALAHFGGLGAYLVGLVGDETLLLDPDGNEFHLLSA